MAFDVSQITKLPPQKLALIGAVGIGGGLLWRKHNASKAATTTAGTTTAGVDTSKFALAENSAGNLAAAQTQQVPSVNDATRDVGQGTINLPVVRWTVNIGGHEFLTDGTTLWNIDGSTYNPATGTTTTPSTLPPSGVIGSGSTAQRYKRNADGTIIII